MKKRNFKNLSLRKESVSNLEQTVLKGGRLGTGSCICGTGGCPLKPTESWCCHQ